MSVQEERGEALLTIDELALAGGMTVRTTRYYASLGLLPPPIRRGRLAYYSDVHLARLELVRALQDHGFTLAAIEKYIKRIPEDASVEDLAMQRAMLTSWAPGPREELTRRQLEKRAGRKLGDDQLERLVLTGAVARTPEGSYELLPAFGVGVQMLDMDIPVDSIVAASEAITRHMDALADELTDILHTRVLEPYRRTKFAEVDAAKVESTMAKLRQLTLEAVVSGFQRAANQVISRSLSKD
ncbi:MAG TPA: MerR family transcriptional regulator [Nocardioidaceae bacterium]|nr:MerR family transcriptional regulator [Nocardioidaceae bacterium]